MSVRERERESEKEKGRERERERQRQREIEREEGVSEKERLMRINNIPNLESFVDTGKVGCHQLHCQLNCLVIAPNVSKCQRNSVRNSQADFRAPGLHVVQTCFVVLSPPPPPPRLNRVG